MMGIGVIVGDDATAFDGMGTAAMLLKGKIEDMSGFCKGRFGVAVFGSELGDDVIVGIAMDRNTFRVGCLAAVLNHPQRFVIDLDQSDRILGDVPIIRDDNGYCFADKANLVLGQDVGPGRLREAVNHLVWRNMVRCQCLRYVGVSINRMDAGVRQRSRRID
jgi:hypothetical protein